MRVRLIQLLDPSPNERGYSEQPRMGNPVLGANRDRLRHSTAATVDAERAVTGGASSTRLTARFLCNHADDHVRGHDGLWVVTFGLVGFQSAQRKFDLVFLSSCLFALPSQQVLGVAPQT